MTENTQIALNTTGDTIRDIDRSLNPNPIAAKTQVMQLDAGGQNAESLVSGANPMPARDPYSQLAAVMAHKQLLVAQGGINGFVPMEIPAFLVG